MYFSGYSKTIPLLNGSNVALFRSAHGFNKALANMATIEEPICFRTHVIPLEDDEQNESTQNDIGAASDPPINQPSTPSSLEDKPPTIIEYENDDLVKFDTSLSEEAERMEEEEVNEATPKQQLLIWHYRLNHVPFEKLQRMAARGDILSHLANCPVPTCASCNYAKATRKPWRSKGSIRTREIPTITKPGDCVSVDQLESSTPGMIAQLRGFLTKDRYTCTTVFVDHHSRL